MSEQSMTPEAEQNKRQNWPWIRLPQVVCDPSFWILLFIMGGPVAAVAVGIYDSTCLVAQERVSGTIAYDSGPRGNTNNKYRVVVNTDDGWIYADYTKEGRPKKGDRVDLVYYYRPVTGYFANAVATDSKSPEAAGK